MMRALTPAQQAAADAAYEQGWCDSLDALWCLSAQSFADGYWYRLGWQRCADYRWLDRNGRGFAPDRNYRIPR